MKFLSINRITLAVVFMIATALYSCQKEGSSSNSSDVTEEEAVALSDESTQAEARNEGRIKYMAEQLREGCCSSQFRKRVVMSKEAGQES